MKIEKLSKDEIELIYNEHIVKDFHENELRPLESILYLYNKNVYKCFKAIEDDETMGYAFFYINGNDVLLDYFATIKKYRSNGYGSIFLKKILKKLNKNNIFIEVEDPDFSKDKQDKFIRDRRIEFYKRNGVYLSNIKVLLFDVNFRIMNNKELDNETVKDRFGAIYKSMMPIRNFKKNVIIY